MSSWPTIFALSTPPGKSALAVIRISGEQTRHAMHQLLATNRKLVPRHAHLVRLQHRGDILDHQALCMWFPKPKSYTGEDMAELHVHGGVSVITGVLEALGRIKDVRHAEPGEFSQRAFYNEKLDLTSLEGIADLINAETQAQRQLAVRQARGELYQMYDKWRTMLIHLRAQIEAVIDFSEEENIEDGVIGQVNRDVTGLYNEIHHHINDKRRGEILRNGARLAIVGPPNSGKSTLMNRLAQRQVSIVSSKAGTTRDILETTLDVGGYPVVVQDTAGVREDTEGDDIEREGIRRALETAKLADMRICMVDIRHQEMLKTPVWKELAKLPHTFVVLNKSDTIKEIGDQRHLLLSCKSGEGWDQLMAKLAGDISQTWSVQNMPLTQSRYRQQLTECMSHLERYTELNYDMVLGAEELRQASDSLGKITGKIGLEDVLNSLFSQFCIGK